MDNKNINRLRSCALLLLTLFLFGNSFAQLTGAIWTTTKNATQVDGNIYDSKQAVYLNGGPPPNAPHGAAALSPDGWYYFQVTDPSEKNLLSTDDISKRQVLVQNGYFVAANNHKTGAGKLPGTITVQLFPFANTPNPGGEYKVMITPVDKYSPGQGSFGFVDAWCKKDNFKVKERRRDPIVSGFKFYDVNGNGVFDDGEEAIAGWQVNIDWFDGTNHLIQTATTGTNGQWGSIIPQGAVSFTVCEVMPNGSWIQTGPLNSAVNSTNNAIASGGCWSGSVGNNDVLDLYFGNLCVHESGGHTIGFWHNQNGLAQLEDDGSLEPELALLRSYSLRSSDGSNYDPIVFYSDINNVGLSDWLTKESNGKNMANMLSVQMTAVILNIEAGFVDGDGLVLYNGGLVSISYLIATANQSLVNFPTTFDNHPERAFQTVLKDIFDAINNNQLVIISPHPCAFSYPQV